LKSLGGWYCRSAFFSADDLNKVAGIATPLKSLLACGLLHLSCAGGRGAIDELSCVLTG